MDIETRNHIPDIANATGPYERVFPLLLHAEVINFGEPQMLLGSSVLAQILDDIPAATRRPWLEDLVGQRSENSSFDQVTPRAGRIVNFTGGMSASQLAGHDSFVIDEEWLLGN